jgi:hypothetical protein
MNGSSKTPIFKVKCRDEENEEVDETKDPQALAHFLANTVKGLQVS